MKNLMMPKKVMSMDVLIDGALTRLFLLAEYVCDRFSLAENECAPKVDATPMRLTMSPISSAPSPVVKTTTKSIERKKSHKIRFTKEDAFVEGELF